MIVDAGFYWIAHTGSSVVHQGYAEADTHVDTGQESLETFDNRPDWVARLAELGATPEETDD